MLIKKVVKKLLWNIKGGYKPRIFWNNWAKTFMHDPWQVETHEQHKWLLKIIKKSKSKTILEVGCGFGRNIKFLTENGISPSKVSGLDISPKMVSLARKYIKNKKVMLYTSDLNDFKTKKKFDLVFTHGVLMHIKEDGINDAINYLINLSNKTLVLIEQNYPAENNYTFTHKYKELLEKRNLDIIEHRSDEKLGLDLIYAQIRQKHKL